MSIIGATIELGGMSDFKNSMKLAGELTRGFNAELKALNTPISGVGKGAGALKSENEILARSLQNSKGKLELLGDELKKESRNLMIADSAVVNMTAGLGANNAATMKAQTAYEKQTLKVAELQTKYIDADADVKQLTATVSKNEQTMRNIERGFNDAGKKVDEFGNEVKESGDKTKRSGKEVDEFGNEVDEAGDKAEHSGGKMKGLFSSISIGGTVANLASKAISSAFGAIKNAMGSAIERVDTLKSFPLVMKNLGYSAEESSAAINKMSDELQGLPTALDTMTVATKSLAPFSKSLDEASDLALALNDAFIASGSSVADADRGMVQYTQMLAKGAVDMQSWRTLQETMGVALQQVAKKLGITSGSTQELYDALKSGTISMDEFNGALLDLDKNGSDGMKNLKEQALDASGGIATSFENIKTAITRGLANAISEVDAKMQENGFGSISDVFKNIKVVVDTVFKGIVAFIDRIMDSIAEFKSKHGAALSESFEKAGAAMKPIVEKIGPVLLKLIDLIVKGIGFVILGIATAIPYIVGAIKAVIDAIKNTIAVITLIVKTVIAVITAIVEGIQSFIDWIKDLPKKIAAVIIAVIGFFASLPGKIWDALVAVVKKVVAWIVNLVETASRIRGEIIDRIVDFFKELPGKIVSAIAGFGAMLWDWAKQLPGKILEGFGDMASLGLQLVEGIWNGIKDATTWVLDKIKGFGKSILDGIKGIFGIKSPSKETAYDGKMIAMGLADGIMDNIKYVNKAVDEVMNVVTDGFNGGANMDINATASYTSDLASQLSDGIKVYHDGVVDMGIDYDMLAAKMAREFEGMAMVANEREIGRIIDSRIALKNIGQIK
jgi:tape measure domain-containing protein